MTWVDHGQAALAELAGRRVDAMVLDLGLGDMDGLDVCAKARESGFAGGILICTARGAELDRVVGLDNGADDYLAKPFSLAELQARVRALLRRTVPAAHPQSVPAAGLAIDRPARASPTPAPPSTWPARSTRSSLCSPSAPAQSSSAIA